MEPNEEQRNEQLRLEVELAMHVGGAFGDCLLPAQAVEVVRDGEQLVISRRPASVGRLLKEAA